MAAVSAPILLAPGDGAAGAVPPRPGATGWRRDTPDRCPTDLAPVAPDPFRRFVETHQRPLYALAHRLTGEHLAADDLVQETFVRAWTAMQRGDAPDAPEAWLRRIAVRLFLNTRRGLARRVVRWTDDLLHSVPDHQVPSDEVTFERAFARALARLSERERAAFVLRHVEDRSTRDTAEALGIAEGTVKALLSRAVSKMQPLLQPYA